MMRIIFMSLLIVGFSSCEWTIYPPLSSLNEKSVQDNLTETAKSEVSQFDREVLLDIDKIKWVNHTATGILLHDSTALFNEDFTFNRYERIEGLAEVKILQKSDVMVRTGVYEDFCNQAYLLKINYLDSIYYVQGTQIYEVNEKPFVKLEWKEDDIEIQTARILHIGAQDEDGLTGCMEDFRVVLVRNTTKSTLNIIRAVDIEELMLTPENLNCFVFDSHAGWFDSCTSIIPDQDFLKFHIQREFQEGACEFDLIVNEHQGVLLSQVVNFVSYDFVAPWEKP